ncbi:hypothetical protein HMPREF9441_01053 [Paraprevotella clara YIT 11840]|uniref:Uncharacterized protein n=1 Tax=Paraprevotella clara YIT 11840 TaxID=762968 RepID=G5SP58_9BACT|nr:hypothetical protein HMPREF9441_01053 [Paraprevotella clara YIT 11840]
MKCFSRSSHALPNLFIITDAKIILFCQGKKHFSTFKKKKVAADFI